ncbi:MAG: hypothetical protein GXP62_00325 [Oligoflexia bacterium]|nr:hypothetical protein [Oligoflexia bacterium]
MTASGRGHADEAHRRRSQAVLQAAIHAAWLGEVALRDGCGWDPDADVGPWCRSVALDAPSVQQAIDFVCGRRLPAGLRDLGDLGWACAVAPEALVALMVEISGRHVLAQHGGRPVRSGRGGDPIIRAWMAGARAIGRRRLWLSQDALVFLHGLEDAAIEDILAPPARQGRLTAAMLRRRWRKVADP